MAQSLRVVSADDGPPHITEIPPPDRPVHDLRTKLSRVRALLLTALGFPRGFFVQYPYTEHLQPVTEPYPEVEALMAAAPWHEFLGEMRAQREAIAGFGADPRDPVLARGMFPGLDGMAAYTAVRKFRPRQIVEIGSGDSTYFLARGVRDNGFGRVTCIDPQPRREIAALDVDFRMRLMTNADADLAGRLEPGDILFIDSSHIMLPGMDVDIQFNRLFPRLKPGVVVHVHDIFLPDDYPAHWRAWNFSEQNALVGWLVSGWFDVIWASRYACTRHHAAVADVCGGVPRIEDPVRGGSLWMRKS